MMRTDHIFVIGAQKCGTSSIFETLRRHPAVTSAVDPESGRVIKEPNFFSAPNWSKGFAWYSALFPDTSRVALDATPEYMTHPHAISMMARMFPQCRVIVTLRDPVQRALSAYNHYMQMLPETESWDWKCPGQSFDLNVISELDSPFESWRGLIGRGDYASQLQNIRQHVPADRIFVMALEEWAIEPRTWLNLLVAFLNLPSAKLTALHLHRRKPSFKTCSLEVMERMRNHFQPLNECLFKMLGRRISQW